MTRQIDPDEFIVLSKEAKNLSGPVAALHQAKDFPGVQKALHEIYEYLQSLDTPGREDNLQAINYAKVLVNLITPLTDNGSIALPDPDIENDTFVVSSPVTLGVLHTEPETAMLSLRPVTDMLGEGVIQLPYAEAREVSEEWNNALLKNKELEEDEKPLYSVLPITYCTWLFCKLRAVITICLNSIAEDLALLREYEAAKEAGSIN